MEFDSDWKLALQIQRQYDVEYNVQNPPISLSYQQGQKRKKDVHEPCLIDPSWELVDPTPNIHQLFVNFNERFFWEKLYTVTVAWSKRMTTCAGICTYKGYGNCFITLSEPLLKLRPRKDLVETLLHEMIHAYLFMTNRDRDRDGHGPEFHKHMYRINKEAGTNISVYHDFHDEVRLYKTHVWRCDGPCRDRPPYYGTIRRAMNRAPSMHDFWWSEHMSKCGGNFLKISAPDPIKPKKMKKTQNLGDITKFVSTQATSTGIDNTHNQNGTMPVTGTTGKENRPNKVSSYSNGTSTKPVGTYSGNGSPNNVTSFNSNSFKSTPPKKTFPASNTKSVGALFGNGSVNNVAGFKSNTTISPKKFEAFVGRGHSLTDGRSITEDYDTVRKAWLNKYNQSQKDSRNTKDVTHTNDCFYQKQTENGEYLSCPNCKKNVRNATIEEHLKLCTTVQYVECPICATLTDIDILNSHVDECLLRNEDNPKTTSKPLKTCDLCDEQVPEESYNAHMEACLQKFYEHLDVKYNMPKSDTEMAFCLVCNKNVLKSALDEHLQYCVLDVFEGDM